VFWCKNNSVLFIRSDRTSLLKHSSLDIISTRLFSKTFSNNFSARPRKNDVLCVGWDVKPYSLAASSSTKRPLRHRSLSGCVVSTVRPFSRNILPHIVSFKLQTTATCGCMAAQVKVRVCGQGPLPPRLNGGPVCDESAAENSTLHKWILPIHRPFFYNLPQYYWSIPWGIGKHYDSVRPTARLDYGLVSASDRQKCA